MVALGNRLQSTDITFSLVYNKVDSLMKQVEVYCESLEKGYHFLKRKYMLNLENGCTYILKHKSVWKITIKKPVLS